MHLELAENNYLSQNSDRESPWIFVPAGLIPGIADDVYVNEKEFDHLPAAQWEKVMDLLERYQDNKGLSLFRGKKGRARKAARKAERHKNKMAKIALRGETGGGIGGVIGGITSMIGQVVGGGGGAMDSMPMIQSVAPPPLPANIKAEQEWKATGKIPKGWREKDGRLVEEKWFQNRTNQVIGGVAILGLIVLGAAAAARKKK